MLDVHDPNALMPWLDAVERSDADEQYLRRRVDYPSVDGGSTSCFAHAWHFKCPARAVVPGAGPQTTVVCLVCSVPR